MNTDADKKFFNLLSAEAADFFTLFVGTVLGWKAHMVWLQILAYLASRNGPDVL